MDDFRCDTHSYRSSNPMATCKACAKLEADNAKLLDIAKWADANAHLRTRLALAETVCEVAAQGPCRHTINQRDCPVCVALKAWREGKG